MELLGQSEERRAEEGRNLELLKLARETELEGIIADLRKEHGKILADLMQAYREKQDIVDGTWKPNEQP